MCHTRLNSFHRLQHTFGRFECLTTAARFDGVPCPAEMEDKRSCNLGDCPVDCVVGDWGNWSRRALTLAVTFQIEVTVTENLAYRL